MNNESEKIIKELERSPLFGASQIVQLKQVQPPSQQEVLQFSTEPEVSAILEHFSDQPDEQFYELQKLAKTFLENNEVMKAWKTLLQV